VIQLKEPQSSLTAILESLPIMVLNATITLFDRRDVRAGLVWVFWNDRRLVFLSD